MNKAHNASGYAFDNLNFSAQGYRTATQGNKNNQVRKGDFVSESNFQPDYDWVKKAEENKLKEYE